MKDQPETDSKQVEELTRLRQQVAHLEQVEEALRQSEARQQALLSVIPELIYRVHRDGTILDFTPPKDFGLLIIEGDCIGRQLAEVLPVEMARERLHHIAQALTTGTPQIYEYQISVEGKPCWREVRVVGCDEDEALVIVRDFSKRQQMELDLRDALRKLSLYIENSPLAVIERDRNCQITCWSRQAEVLFGWQAEEVIGKLVGDWPFVFVSDVDRVKRTMEALRNYEQQHNISLNRNYTKDGSVIDCEWHNSALLDESGQLISTLSVALDVTERKRSEESIRRSAAEINQVFNMLPNFVWKFCLNTPNSYEFVYASDIVTELSGIAKQEFLQNPQIWNTYIDADRESQEAIQTAWQAIQQGEPYRVVYLFHTLHRGPRWFETTARPAIEAGKLYYYGSTTDITERKQAEEALQLSEERYRTLVAASAQVIWRANPAGEIFSASTTWQELTGQSQQELQGYGWLNAVHPDDREPVQTIWARALEQKNVCEVEYRIRDQVGSYRDLKVRAVPMLLKDGSVREWIGTCTDITEQKQAEAALRINEERFRLAVDNFPDVFVIYDAERRLQFVNAEGVRRSGHTEESLLGHTDDELFPPEVTDNYLPTLQRAIETRTAQTAECTIVLPTIGTHTLIVTYVPLLNGQGEIHQILGITRDITASKQAEANRLAQERAKQLEAEMLELQRLHQLKDDFLSTVSHELRTPMSNIRMAIRMFEIVLKQAGLLPSESEVPAQPANRIAQYLQLLSTECEREISLINDLLDLQRLDAGMQAFNLERVQLQSWLPEQLHSFQERAHNRQQTLHLALPPELPAFNCDASCLERILCELLNNACKYTPPGEHITVSVYAGSDFMQFQVCNTGVEIPERELPFIFDRFYRIPGADSWRQGGTGLGLALVQKLVSSMGGSIRAESLPEETCFTVALPLGHSAAS
ncbi:PAS domain S-box protein [Leptolyngbya sp. FACHB-261]|uniref:sensor histidine kinase n=1 Tax=Leptolyngbya sp. FACHB-261 TaxID=2692806 RepID=UPI0016851440|nr:PAS domain S-box protein [Leptolyngbya sp. FACHB-261]MBD2103649.1 PAS domain S-box protein [Leptolyngbya sp. FACHB-261]